MSSRCCVLSRAAPFATAAANSSLSLSDVSKKIKHYSARIAALDDTVQRYRTRVQFLEARIVGGNTPDPVGNDADTAWRMYWTTNQPTKQDLEKEEHRLEIAKQDLEKEEMRLRDAKQELEKEQLRLEKEEQRLRDANIPVANICRGFDERMELSSASCRETRCFGRSQFFKSVFGRITAFERLMGPTFTLQLSESLLLRSASGVGKTFATIAFRTQLKNFPDIANWVRNGCGMLSFLPSPKPPFRSRTFHL
jgi:hypothetical protein